MAADTAAEGGGRGGGGGSSGACAAAAASQAITPSQPSGLSVSLPAASMRGLSDLARDLPPPPPPRLAGHTALFHGAQPRLQVSQHPLDIATSHGGGPRAHHATLASAARCGGAGGRGGPEMAQNHSGRGKSQPGGAGAEPHGQPVEGAPMHCSGALQTVGTALQRGLGCHALRHGVRGAGLASAAARPPPHPVFLLQPFWIAQAQAILFYTFSKTACIGGRAKGHGFLVARCGGGWVLLPPGACCPVTRLLRSSFAAARCCPVVCPRPPKAAHHAPHADPLLRAAVPGDRLHERGAVVWAHQHLQLCGVHEQAGPAAGAAAAAVFVSARPAACRCLGRRCAVA